MFSQNNINNKNIMVRKFMNNLYTDAIQIGIAKNITIYLWIFDAIFWRNGI